MTATADPATDEIRLERIPLEDLHDSPLNPRRHYAPDALEELATSLERTGQLEPVLVRPRPAGGYELASGHRRRRAAVLAGLPDLLAIVRDMDEPAFVEALNVANLQRDDLHPMEEAEGFKTLMTTCGYDVQRLAERCGRRRDYVYDRLALLQLTKEAKKLFLAGGIPTTHAIELARLSADDQARAMASDRSDNGRIGGLFVPDYGQSELEVDVDPDGEEPRKPVSLAEFRRWIADHVRFDPTNKHVPELFPETAATLARAETDDLKVVKITRDYRLADEARDPKERTYGSQSWKRADGVKAEPDDYGRGAKKAATCDHSVIGVVVAGPGRGESFPVCVAKTTCKVHWTKEQKEAAGRREGKQTAAAKPARRPAWEIENERREKENARLWAARSEIKAHLTAAVELLTADQLAGWLLDDARVAPKARTALAGKSLLDVGRWLVQAKVDSAVQYEVGMNYHVPPLAKRLGVKLASIVAAKEKAAAPKALDEKTAACEKCGCTWDAACPGGCSWDQAAWAKGKAICSSCIGKPRRVKARKAKAKPAATATKGKPAKKGATRA